MTTKYTSLFAFILILQHFGFAQRCGMTPQMGEEMLIRTQRNINQLRSQPIQQRDVFYLPITFHVVYREDGLDTLSTDKILDQMCQINTIYDPDFQFYIKNIRKIVNSDIYYDHTNFTTLMASMIDETSINVWIVGDIDLSGENVSAFFPAGYYSPGNNWIIMNQDYIGMGETALPHQLGHYWGLPHTFAGCATSALVDFFMGNDPQVPDSLTLGCALELQDGSNCSTTGDLICDTPPDYGFGYQWTDCNYTAQILDQNGEEVHPMEENLMGSFIGNDCEADDFRLTPTQIDLMRMEINSLPPFPAPEDTEITTSPTLISPVNNEVTPFYDNILLEWEAVEGATFYFLEISPFPTFTTSLPLLTTTVSDHSILLSSDFFAPGKKYYWKVRPFNFTHTCSPFSPSASFSTGTISNISKIEAVEQINIIPNPVRGGNFIKMEMTTSKSFDGKIQLYNTNGQQIGQSFQQHFLLGRSQIKLPHKKLPAGLYFIKITKESQQITKKIMITD